MEGLWIAIGTVITGALTGIGVLIGRWQESRKVQRADAISEWKDISDRQRADIDAQTIRINDLNKAVLESVKAEALCQKDVARLEGEIRLLQSVVSRLQQKSGDELTSVVSGIIIADLSTMIIKDLSPALGPILGWLKRDLVGKSVETIIPERYLGTHREAIKRIQVTSQLPWTERVITGHALTADGHEVPVSVTLSGWQSARGDTLISANIRRLDTVKRLEGKRP